jgi:hypothetical protein
MNHEKLSLPRGGGVHRAPAPGKLRAFGFRYLRINSFFSFSSLRYHKRKPATLEHCCYGTGKGVDPCHNHLLLLLLLLLAGLLLSHSSPTKPNADLLTRILEISTLVYLIHKGLYIKYF